jgi:hypothetical protein
MKKITFLIALMLSAMFSAFAQPVSGYTRTVLTGQTYTPIAGGTVINTAAGLTAGYMSASQDDGAVLVTLPFTFNYGGNNFTQVTFCTNGWIGMGAQSAVTALQSRTAGNLWSTTLPNNTIAPWFGDLGANFPTGGGSMVHGTVGTDVYAFEWQNAVANGFQETTANRLNFMVKIYGPASSNPGRIEFLYGSTIGTVNTGRAIGIEDGTGGAGNFINALNGSSISTTTASAWPGNGAGYRFDPGTTACTTLSGGTVPAVLSACSGSAPALIEPIGVTAPFTGVTYAWEQSTDGGTTWVAVVGGTGAATRYYTPPAYAGTPIKYRLKVSCGSEIAYSTVADFSGPAVPFTQATNLSFTQTPGQIVVNFTPGSGTRRMVVVSDSPISDPQNVETGGSAITAAAAYAGGEQIVYDGTGSTVTVTAIPCSGGTYYVKVFEYTRCGTAGNYTILFNTSTGTNASTVVVNPLAAPTTQASNAVLVPGTGQFTVNWTNGNGNYRFVYVDTNPIPDPIDEIGIAAPTANTVFQNNGLQLVYNATGSSVTVTGLPCAPGEIYYVKVFEVNRCGVTGAFDYVFNTTTTTNALTYTLVAPTTQSSGLTVTPGLNSAAITWVNGNGVRRRVVVSDVPIVDPVDEIGVAEITAASFYQGGQQNVYDGTGTTFTVTGLSCTTQYYVRVYEYFRCGTTGDFTYLYNTTATSGNSTTFTTTGPMAAVALPQATTFTGFTGDNLSTVFPGWKESAIPTPALTTPLSVNPSGTTSSWTSSNILGSPTAKVNLFVSTRNEWIISPRMNVTAAARLKFKAAMTNFNTGAVDNDGGIANTDDKISVLISNDACGANWQTIYEFNSTNALTNQLTQFEFPIDASYIGQQVYIAFQATDGPADEAPDYDFHIGDVRIELIPQCDIPVILPDAVSVVTENGATVAWAGPSTGNPTGYQYVFSTTNTAPSTDGTPISTTGITVNTLSSSTEYFTWVRTVCGSTFSNWVMVGRFRTLCDAPEILTTTPATRCGIGTATLAATSNAGTIYWYAAATGGSPIGTGPSFTTPSISATTTYYAGASSGSGVTTVGPASPTAQGGTIGSQTVQWDVEFAVLVPTTLKSVDIFPNTAGGNGVISVRTTSGTVIANYPYVTTVGGGTTPQTIVLDHTFEPGNYELYTTTIPAGGIQRNTSGATYPYTSPVANILNNGFDQTYFMGMYNWQFETGCSSARQAVIATVTTAPEITVANTVICAGQSANLSVTSSNANYTYVWTPGNLTGAQQTVNPSATTTYTVTATDSGTGCVNTATVTVTVNALPNAISVTPSASQVCATTPVALTATGSTASGNAVLGTGTVTPAATGVPNPLTGYYGGQWTQMLYKKSELEAQGMAAGSVISTLAFDLSAAQADLVENFTIRIGHSSVEDMSAGFVPVAPLTTVYYEAQMTPVAGVTGLKVFTLTTPFTWNGTSNLIVEVVHNQGTGGTTSGTVTKATTTPFVSVYYLRVDNVAGGVAGFQTQDYSAITTKGALSNRPNIVLNYSYSNNVTWSPVTGLYTDSAATTPYTGQPATTVYALPTVNTTYIATTTNASNCTATDDAVVSVGAANTPTGSTSQVISVNSPEEATIEDIVVAETSVIWYASLSDAIAGQNALAAGTQLQAGSVYYGTLPGGSCTPLAVTITEILGSKGFNKAQFSYYPNPVKDVLNLKYSNEITGVEVYNLLGQKVMAKQVNATETTVDMAHIAEGNYIVKVTSGDSVETIKIVKRQ